MNVYENPNPPKCKRCRDTGEVMVPDKMVTCPVCKGCGFNIENNDKFNCVNCDSTGEISIDGGADACPTCTRYAEQLYGVEKERGVA